MKEIVFVAAVRILKLCVRNLCLCETRYVSQNTWNIFYNSEINYLSFTFSNIESIQGLLCKLWISFWLKKNKKISKIFVHGERGKVTKQLVKWSKIKYRCLFNEMNPETFQNDVHIVYNYAVLCSKLATPFTQLLLFSWKSAELLQKI